MDKNKLWISKDDMKRFTLKAREYEIVDVEKNIISTPYHYNNIRIDFDEVARRFFCLEDDGWVDLPRRFYHECYNKLVIEKESCVSKMDFMKINMSEYHRDSDVLEVKDELMAKIDEQYKEKYLEEYKEQMKNILKNK